MPNTETPAGTAGGPVALPDLPEKLRVHALAKLLGRASREVLAALADLGVEVRSAQSSLDRVTAEKVAAALQPATGTAEPAPAESAPAEPEPVAEVPTEAAADAPAEAPAPRTRRRRATRATGASAASADGSAAETAETTAAPDADTAPAAEAAPAATVFPPTGFAPPEPAAAPAGAPEAALAPLFAPPAAVFQPPTRPTRTRRRAAGPAAEEPEETPAEETPAVDAATEAAEDTTGAPDDDGDGDDDGSRRRRRRGRRGRGRGKGGDEESGSDESDDATSDESDESGTGETAEREGDESDAEDDGDDSDDESRPSGSRRRRRRRRRGGNGEDGDEGSRDDDPPGTVVRVRAPRERAEEAGDGVQGVRGSTRLEAKRQRRRDGRDAGRRRVPVLSEAEFLARREAVDRTMVVRERGDRVEIGVLEDSVLVEHFIADTHGSGGTGPSMVGNIYLGRVQNVLPSMEAAFVDIGRGRNAVLYAGEVDWDAAGLGGKARRIEQALSSGDSVLVQVTKDPVGHKGARLTTQISLAGRFLVYVPSGGAAGISRKLPDVERKRLKDLLKEIVPAEAGVIIRTASEGVSHEALERDVRRLQAQWEVVKAKAEATGPNKPKAPVLLYEEPDLLIKVVRDQFNEDFSALIVQGDDAWDTLHGYVTHVAPELASRMHRHVGSQDVFAEHRIDEQLLKALDRKVWLPSGGTLVIDRTEAMTVVDVNTGKYTGSGGNLEETVTRNNLEAAEEVVRQLRLRDIGGIIVIDFIDMVLEANRDLVLRRLTECLSRDRTRHQVAEVTSLGLVQMTRKRVGGGLLEHFSTPCEHCRGRGVVVDVDGPADTGREPARSGNGGGNGGGNGSGEGGGRRSRGGRGRRGGDAGAPDVATRPEPVVAEPVVAEPVVPEPVVPEPVTPATVAHDPVLDVGAPAVAPGPVGAVVDERPDAAAEAVEEAVVERSVAAHGTAAPESTPGIPTPDIAAAGVPVAEVAAAAAPVAEPAPAVDDAADADRNGHQARPARRRGRVTRTAGAPSAAAGDAPAAVVLTVPAEAPASQAPEVAEPAPAPVAVPPQPEPAPATTRTRRTRRAASRPAGPPPGTEESAGDPV